MVGYRRFGTAYPSHLYGQEVQDSSRTASHLKKTRPIGSPEMSVTKTVNECCVTFEKIEDVQNLMTIQTHGVQVIVPTP